MKNSYLKLTAIIAAAMIVGGSLSVLTYAAVSGKQEDTKETSAGSTSESTTQTAAAGKDETVYVLANADGSVKKVIVSDWIKNSTGAAKLTDKSQLSDVKNVKGDQSYTMDENNMRVWDAEGGDIYSQGTTDKALPVKLTVTYKLDGKTVSPSELAGKSGRVTVRFDYTDNQYEDVAVDGVTQRIYVPFVMLTGMVLDSDKFSNIEVTNGKIIGDGTRTAVVGFALPGLGENLKIDSDKLEIPDYTEFSADTTDFELTTTLTLATNSVFNELDLDSVSGLSELTASMDKLTDSMKKLTDGSSVLYGGLSELLGKSGALITGIDRLSAGTEKLSAGTAALNAGLKELTDNNAKLNGGAEQVFNTLLDTASSQIAAKGITTERLTIDNYKSVLGALLTSPDATQSAELAAIADAQLEVKLANVPEAYHKAVKVMIFDALASGAGPDEAMAQAAAAMADPASNAQKIQAAAADPAADVKIQKLCLTLAGQTLAPVINELIASLDSYNEFYTGIREYTAGAAKAYAGSTELAAGAAELNSGAGELKTGAAALVAGVTQLKDGSMQLSDGIKQLDEQGIKKLVSVVNGDIGGLVSRLRATVDVSKRYQSFASDDNGSVKFIYKTDSIEKQ